VKPKINTHFFYFPPWSILKSPWFVGSVLGLSFALANLGGGLDAYIFFFRDTIWSVPPWVHVFLKPIAMLVWPYSYALLTFLTLLIFGLTNTAFGGRWWLAIFSAPVFWEIWSGQVDWMVALGILLAFLVLNGRLRPFWFGLVWIFMFSKPWVGIFAIPFLTWFAYKQYGWKPLLPAVGLSIGIVVMTFLYKPSWYISGEIFKPFELTTRHTAYSTNGAFWPWTLFAWILVPSSKSLPVVLRRILAATLLTSPFLHLYHASVFTVLIENKKIAAGMFIIGWAIVATSSIGYNWSSLSWIYPLSFLLLDWSCEKTGEIFKKPKIAPVPQ
jgi:hypothetical protein